MLRVKKQLLIKNFLFIFLGFLFIFNKNKINAIENTTQNNLKLNDKSEYIVFKNLLFIQEKMIQKIINASRRNAEKKEIKFLLVQLKQINQQIITYQKEILIDLDRNNIRIQLEKKYLLFMLENILCINRIPIHFNKKYLNILKNIKTRINQNQLRIDNIIQQIQKK
ncbi:hypothetical protein ['Camptotheca acuminata' phytoplasma]|uniref:hypothetical protein n=1 Tax='Camptotheca acuminata' phytoplasma TaxID=3239192 RepID=UPI00351AAE0B